MKKNLTCSLTTVLALGCLASSSAWAVTLATDPSALAGFRGSQNFASGTLSATLDYAVYAPGTYSLGANGGVDPSGGTRYVYAYEIFNTSSVSPVSVSTIGQIPSSAATFAANAGSDAANLLSAGGIAPSSSPILSASVKFNFEAPEIGINGHSRVLLYTSPFPPRYANGTVSDGGFTDQHLVPSPTPEPATAVIFGVAVLGMSGFGRRRIART